MGFHCSFVTHRFNVLRVVLRDDEDNCFFTNDATARVQEMDADLRPYF